MSARRASPAVCAPGATCGVGLPLRLVRRLDANSDLPLAAPATADTDGGSGSERVGRFPPLVAEGAGRAATASAGGRQALAAALVQSVWRGYTDRRKLSDLMEDLGYFDEGGEFSLADFHYVRHAP